MLPIDTLFVNLKTIKTIYQALLGVSNVRLRGKFLLSNPYGPDLVNTSVGK